MLAVPGFLGVPGLILVLDEVEELEGAGEGLAHSKLVCYI